ncbi:TcaA 3rd/4th domain-containing protein [Numidum massiliense]|uniref:TcaA 3rd/4th domain-containing protein n=1 Tax=Numidum massiliense TaxID=1522315 RepID=UPI0006D55C92|nr:hypothetical protein [Numidum massiliense]
MKRSDNKQQQSEATSRSSKMLWTIISAMLIFVAVFGLYTAGESMASPRNLAGEMVAAIDDKDAAALAALLTTEDEELSLDKTSLNNFINFLHKNEKAYKKLTKHLEQQIAAFESGAKVSKRHATINLQPQGKKWGIYDSYRLVVSPATVNVSSNIGASDIYVDGKKSGTVKEGKTASIGPLPPGSYELKAVAKDKQLQKAETKQKLTLFQLPKAEKKVALSFDAHPIAVTSTYANAEIYVNGESTGLTVGEAKSFGPLPVDGSAVVTLKKQFPWGVVESDEVKVTDKQLRIDFAPIPEEMQKQLTDVLNDHLEEHFAALAQADEKKVKHVTNAYRKNFAKQLKTLTKEEKKNASKVSRASYDTSALTEPKWNKKEKRYELIVDFAYVVNEDKDQKKDQKKKDSKAKDDKTKDRKAEADGTQYVSQLVLSYDEKEEQWLIDDMTTAKQLKAKETFKGDQEITL